jgi:uncharacterized protein YukE
MSLDHTLEGLTRFSSHFERYNAELRISLRDLKERQAALDRSWNDEARAACDRAISDLQQRLAHYINSESEQFELFLQQKIRELGNYLHGN